MSDYDEFIDDPLAVPPDEPKPATSEPEGETAAEPAVIAKPEEVASTSKSQASKRPDKAKNEKKQDVKNAINRKVAESKLQPTGKLAVFHDDRNLTKAGKAVLADKWSEENRGKSRNGMMAAFAAAAKEKFGATKVFGSKQDLEQLCVGIPTPSLPIEYAIANDVLPFALMMLAGSWGSCKSSLLFEFFRWVHELNGLPFHIDTEHKFDGDFACRIMRQPEGPLPFVSNRCDSTEEWQSMFTHYVSEVKRLLRGTKEAPGPGATIPVAIGLDSLAASLSEEIQDKVMEEGYANRAHPVDALKNKNYLNAIIPKLANHPFMVFIVNHLKTRKDDRGIEHAYTLGGGNVNFRESVELHMSVWRSKFKNAQFEGIGVRIACAKNSFGPTHRTIKTRFLWWYDEDEITGELIQRVTWDWDWAICDLLQSAEGINKNRLKKADLELKVKSAAADIECMANMRALGMGKDEYLSWQEVGRMIHENAEVSQRIREALGIKIRPKLVGGISLQDIQAKYRKAAE
jgi:hypothetical protein